MHECVQIGKVIDLRSAEDRRGHESEFDAQNLFVLEGRARECHGLRPSISEMKKRMRQRRGVRPNRP